jgi:hypothetical protein
MRRTLVGTEDASIHVSIINEDQRAVESIQDALKARRSPWRT